MIELYHHGTSVCAAKVRLALAEKGVEWTGRYVDILAGEQFTPEFRRLNPEALVPVLVHDGQVIRESTVINEYIDESFVGPALCPATPAGRAAMRLWTKLVDEVLHPAVGPLTFAVSHRYTVLDLPEDRLEAYITATPDPVQRERKRRWIFEGLDAPDVRAGATGFIRAIDHMEQALRDSPWLAGEGHSLADIALTPYLNRLDMLGVWALWKGEHPGVDSWFERVRARGSFGPALFDYMPDTLRETMIANGRKAAPRLKALLAEIQT